MQIKHYLALIAVTDETAPAVGIFNVKLFLHDSTTVHSAGWNQSRIILSHDIRITGPIPIIDIRQRFQDSCYTRNILGLGRRSVEQL